MAPASPLESETSSEPPKNGVEYTLTPLVNNAKSIPSKPSPSLSWKAISKLEVIVNLAVEFTYIVENVKLKAVLST